MGFEVGLHVDRADFDLVAPGKSLRHRRQIRRWIVVYVSARLVEGEGDLGKGEGAQVSVVESEANRHLPRVLVQPTRLFQMLDLLYVEDGAVGQGEEDGVALVALVLVSICKRRQDRVLPIRILGQGGRVRRDAELGRLNRLLLWFGV